MIIDERIREHSRAKQKVGMKSGLGLIRHRACINIGKQKSSWKSLTSQPTIQF